MKDKAAKAAYDKIYRATHIEHRNKEARAAYMKAYHAAYYALHKDELSIKGAAYRAEHSAERKTNQAAYRAEHRAELNAKETARYTSKRKTINDERAAYEAAHQDEVAAALIAKRDARRLRRVVNQRRRDARKMRAPVNDLTAEQWADRLSEFRGCCGYCLKPSDKLTQEHMTPLSRGGAHTLSNVVPTCPECNWHKHTKTLLEYVIAGGINA